MEEYTKKVFILAKVKYDLDEEVIESYSEFLEECYNSNFTPRRVVELIARDLFNS